MERALRRISIIFIIWLLHGCGGGSAETSPPPSPPANQPPNVNAGEDLRVTETQTILLNASASDADGSITTVSWSQLSGPEVTLSNSASLTTEVTFPDITERTKVELRVTVTDNNGAQVSDTLSISVIPVVTATFDIEETGITISKIVSGTQGRITPDSHQQAEIEDSGISQLITVFDSSDNLSLMALVTEQLPDVIEVNSLTTYEALLRLIPTVNLFLSKNPDFFTSQIAPLQEVQAVKSYISNTPDWSLEQSEFEALFIKALDQALLKINEQADINNATSKLIGKQFSQSIYIGGGNDNITPGYSHTWFKTTVTLLPANNTSDDFNIKIENSNYRRWLIAMITDDPEAEAPLVIDNNRVFIIPSESDVLPQLLGNIPSVTSPVIAAEDYPSNSIKQENYGVHVYGFALGDTDNRPLQGSANSAYWMTMGLTVMFDGVLPFLGTWIPILDNADCVADTLSPDKLIRTTADGFAEKIAESNAIRGYILNSEYDAAVAEALILVSDTISSGALDCLAFEDMEILDKLKIKFARVASLIKRSGAILQYAGLTISETNAYLEHRYGKSYRFWHINNSTTMNLLSAAPDAIPAPTSGSLHYSDTGHLAEFSDSLTSNFIGTCDTSDPKILCEAYTFDNELPYSVDLTLSCSHPITNEAVPCKSASLSYQFANHSDNVLSETYTEVDPDGKISLTIEFEEPAEVSGEIILTDYVGGQSDKRYFNLQVKEAQPQLRVYQNGVELPYNIDNGVMTLLSPVYLNADTAGVPQDTEIEIVNTGFGTAIIDFTTWSNDSRFVVETEPGDIIGRRGFNNPDGKKSIKVTYTPQNDGEEFEAHVELRGKLGEPSLHSGIGQDEFNLLRITFAAAPCSRVVESPDSFAVYYERIYCEEGTKIYDESLRLYAPDPAADRQALLLKLWVQTLDTAISPQSTSNFIYQQRYIYSEVPEYINQLVVERTFEAGCTEENNAKQCAYQSQFKYESPSDDFLDIGDSWHLSQNGIAYHLYHDPTPITADREWFLMSCPGYFSSACLSTRLSPDTIVLYGNEAIRKYKEIRDNLLNLESSLTDNYVFEINSTLFNENAEAQALYIVPWYQGE